MEVVNSYNSSSPASGSSHTAPAVSAAPSVKADTITANTAATTEKRQPSAVPQELQDALASIDLPDVADGSALVELNFNQDTGRVVAKVTDRYSGDILREIPSKELQQLFSQMREYLGSFVDEEI
ncbi:MAG: flagellar protein FlaG [Rhodospirillales bacterium]|nr:flagellar protein FlaG [Rhodospirillales bacterium]